MNMTKILLIKGHPPEKMGQHLAAGYDLGKIEMPFNILSDVSYSKLNRN